VGNYKFNAFSIIAGACACRSGTERLELERYDKWPPKDVSVNTGER